MGRPPKPGGVGGFVELVVSRWFIVDNVRTRAGQWQLTLHRDVIADYYNIIKDSPAYIEKSNLHSDSPFIFNKEDFTVNQIKKNETLLKDKSGCPWIVGYYSRDSAGDIKGTANTIPVSKVETVPIGQSIETWKYYPYREETGFLVNSNPRSVKCCMDVRHLDISTGWRFYIDIVSGQVNSYGSRDYRNATLASAATTNGNLDLIIPSIERAVQTVGIQSIESEAINYIDYDEDINDLLQYQGKIIRDINGKVFKVELVTHDDVTTQFNVTAGNLFNTMSQVVNNCTYPNDTSLKTIVGTPDTTSFKVQAVLTPYSIKLTELTYFETSYDLSSSTRLNTYDAPYDIFAIPCGEITVLNNGQPLLNKTDAQIALAIAADIGRFGSNVVYDIQLLPYCPIPDSIVDNGVINVSQADQYSLVTGEGLTKGIIFNVPSSKFNAQLDYHIDCGVTSIEKKVNNQCDKWRLTSPNYANYFDFSVEMNYGVDYFDIDCEYKPMSPYIHINPNFRGLYGYDDNSPRGLILGGDFSLSRVKDSWLEYQLNNKNFQQTFDRQIQNMEIQHKYQRMGDITQAITGTMGGAAAGALAGSVVPGIGTAVGAVVGGIASAAGGIADIRINEKLRQEALDYTKDMFNYQLGNIQALPDPLSKVSAFNPNNKIFPVLEYYTCTEEERLAFINKLAYNGMTNMVIGTINDYSYMKWAHKGISSKNYIKCKLIRFIEENVDYRIVNEVSKELNMGFYLN